MSCVSSFEQHKVSNSKKFNMYISDVELSKLDMYTIKLHSDWLTWGFYHW